MNTNKKYVINGVELTIDNIGNYTKMDYWDDIDVELAKHSYSLVLGRHCEISTNIIQDYLIKTRNEDEYQKMKQNEKDRKERLLKWRDEQNSKSSIKHIELDFTELLNEKNI
jgi:hypothetical protein